MHHVPFYVNGAEWSGGAEILAGAAADAPALVDGGDHYRLAVVLVFHHLDSTSGAVAGAVAAADTIGEHYAVGFYPYGMTHVNGGLLFFGDGLDGTRGTDLAATGTLGTAVADLVGQGRLHKVHQVGRRLQDMVGASGDAELAGRAVLL